VSAERPVPLRSAERLFARLHRSLLDAHTPAIPWDALDPSVLDDQTREHTRRAWAARTLAEYRSLAVFAEVLARMPEAGAPLPAITALTRLVQDEARHTELCARMAEVLGGTHDCTLPPEALRATSRLRPALFIARQAVSMFCVGEAASVALLDELLAGVTDPCAAAVLRVIRRDERLHERYGLALARWAIAQLDEEELAWLGADTALALAHYDRVNAGARRIDAEPFAEPAAPAGPDLGLRSASRFAWAFYRKLDADILPSLERLGLPARLAWRDRFEAERLARHEAGFLAGEPDPGAPDAER
jgi:hypothetical protein